MKLLELQVEGYRSLKRVTWTPGDLNVLIGPNGSGKTNLIRVLELVTIAARGGLGKHVQREGGMTSLLWDETADTIRIYTKSAPLPLGKDERGEGLTYILELSQIGFGSEYRIEKELLERFYEVNQGRDLEWHKLLERDPHNAKVFDENQQVLKVPSESLAPEETLLSLAAGPFTQNRWISFHQRVLSSWSIHQFLYTFRDAVIRQPAVVRHETRMSSSGGNLVPVLHTLYTQTREFKVGINDAMQAAFGMDFEELVFPPAADQLIQLRIRWKTLQREVAAADLSDGTLRFLFLISVLADPNPPPMIVIEEPEIGLHPSMLRIIAEYAVEAASRTQVIFTTHSPDFLGAFRDTVPTTTVFGWENGETNLRTLSGQDLDYWLKEYSVGELFRSGQLESME